METGAVDGRDDEEKLCRTIDRDILGCALRETDAFDRLKWRCGFNRPSLIKDMDAKYVNVVVVESLQASENGAQAWLVGGRQAHPLSLLLGGDSVPSGEQNTETRDASLFLPHFHIFCIVFFCPARQVLSFSQGWVVAISKTDKSCDVSLGHFCF